MSDRRAWVLGRFEVEGADLSSLTSRKARTVAKVLVLHHGRMVGTDTLIDAAWGDALPRDPVPQLKVLVSRVRAVLGRTDVSIVPGGYRLDLGWLDRDELLEHGRHALDALDHGDLSAARREAMAALALAQGSLLPDEPDAQWAIPARTTVDRAVGRARGVAAEAARRLGEPATALELARQALDADPYDEGALRTIMRAQQSLGNNGAGLAAYAQMRSFLAEDLGVDPSPATEGVYLELLLDDAPAVASMVVEPVASRPVSVNPPTIVGRGEVLGRLIERASARRGLVTLIGEPGIGKTVLLDAFETAMTERSVVVLRGTCVEPDRARPLQAPLDALRDRLSRMTPADALVALGPQGHLLGSLSTGLDDRRLPPAWWGDGAVGRLFLFDALAEVFARLSATAPVVLIIDDAHLAPPSTLAMIDHLIATVAGVVVVLSARPGPIGIDHGGDVIALEPLDLQAVATIVGETRATALLERSGGNPLFLRQLADEPDDALPATLVDAINERVERLTPAADTVRTAAIIGNSVDIDLVANVLGRPALAVLADIEAAEQAGIIDSAPGTFVFHHALVRDALVIATSTARQTLVHRLTARALSSRPGADPLEVALHAREGGDVMLASLALRDAADRALARFDHEAAEGFLTEAIDLADRAPLRMARARARLTRGDNLGALADVDVALTAGGGSEALDIGAWAAYFARRFDDARQFADDGVELAGDPVVRASCLTIAGRVRHAAGDVHGAERMLIEAVDASSGARRALARVWLGVLRSHQSRTDEALELLRTMTLVEAGAVQTTELLHALMFTGHALALAGRPLEALEAFDRYDIEVERRQVPRFVGRGRNFSGWVRRGLGDFDRADDENGRALDQLGNLDFRETTIAAHIDLAEGALLRGALDDAEHELGFAEGAFGGALTFGWRQALKLQLDRARVSIARGDGAGALHAANVVANEADRLGLPRYRIPARLLGAQACHLLGERSDDVEIERLLGDLDRTAGLDAWWITAEMARVMKRRDWADLARARALELAVRAGAIGAGLPTAVDRVLRL